MGHLTRCRRKPHALDHARAHRDGIHRRGVAPCGGTIDRSRHPHRPGQSHELRLAAQHARVKHTVDEHPRGIHVQRAKRDAHCRALHSVHPLRQQPLELRKVYRGAQPAPINLALHGLDHLLQGREHGVDFFRYLKHDRRHGTSSVFGFVVYATNIGALSRFSIAQPLHDTRSHPAAARGPRETTKPAQSQIHTLDQGLA